MISPMSDGGHGARAIRPYLVPEWRALTVAAVATTAVVAAWLARPLPLALVVDHLIGRREGPFELTSDDWRLLGLVAGLVLLIGLVNALGGHLADDRLSKAGERITHRLRMATYAQLQRLSLSFHERRQAGDLVTRVTGDVSAVGSLFSGALGNLVSSGMLLLGMFTVSFLIDPLLALTAFAAAPVLALVSFRFRGRVKSLARAPARQAGRDRRARAGVDLLGAGGQGVRRRALRGGPPAPRAARSCGTSSSRRAASRGASRASPTRSARSPSRSCWWSRCCGPRRAR